MSNTNTRAALATRKQNGGAAPASGDIRSLIERQKPEIARALTGTALDPERFARIALTVIRQSKQLQQCRPESVLGALMTSAQLGLEPGPLGEAYLVPYKDECTFITGYQGMIKLAFQSGQVRHIDADVVRTGDDFDYAKGAEPVLRHKPALTGRGEAVCYYAVASFVQGGHVAVVLSPEDVNKTRDRSASAKSAQSPWKSDYDAMAKKTCIRQLAKFLPMHTGLSRALQADGSVRTTVDATVDEVAGDWIDGDVVDPETPQSEPTAPAEDAAKGAPATAEAASEPRAGKQQRDDITAMFTKLGITDSAERLNVISTLVQRPATTISDVTELEGTQLADILTRCLGADEPPRALDAVLSELQDAEGGDA